MYGGKCVTLCDTSCFAWLCGSAVCWVALKQPSKSSPTTKIPRSSRMGAVDFGLFSRRYFSIFFFIEEFQWFLIALSVRPGNILAISAHLFPNLRWLWRMRRSSLSDQFLDLLMFGLRWLCQRSRHCFPVLPTSWEAIWLHFLGPTRQFNMNRSGEEVKVLP